MTPSLQPFTKPSPIRGSRPRRTRQPSLICSASTIWYDTELPSGFVMRMCRPDSPATEAGAGRIVTAALFQSQETISPRYSASDSVTPVLSLSSFVPRTSIAAVSLLRPFRHNPNSPSNVIPPAVTTGPALCWSRIVSMTSRVVMRTASGGNCALGSPPLTGKRSIFSIVALLAYGSRTWRY